MPKSVLNRMIFNKYVFIVCSTSVCKAIRTERKIEKKIKAYFLKTVLLFFHSLLVLSLLFEFRVCVFFFFVFLSQVLLQWNQSLNRCLKQDVKNNTEKNKKLFLRMTFCFTFRVEAVDAEVATKRLKSSNVFYSMTVVVQTNSFIQQEISEG